MKSKITAQQKANFNHADRQSWLDAGFTDDDARAWKSYGFSWRTAPGWRETGFTPGEAADWRNATSKRDDPILPDEAIKAKRNGETPHTYRYNRNRTYPHPMQTR